MELANSLYGVLLGPNLVWGIIASVLLVLAMGYTGARFVVWTVGISAILLGFGAPAWLILPFVVIALIFNIPPVRAMLVSSAVMKVMKGFLPKISDTERTALEAGQIWVEADLFSGKPDFKKILNEPYPTLTAEEQAFMDGPVNDLCEACNDWEIWETRQLPEKAWDVIKREKFLGMIIPKKFGGLGFSALAQSAVLQKLASRSIPATVTVMVPNSLGPAELLLHYGTDAQKEKYLPKLASGEEIPCFALTEPTAGSDAGSLVSSGTLFKDSDGSIKMKLNWNKRWITLAAISTTLGLAFRLYDPENLLGRGEDLGITCALVPSNTPGVEIGRRHDPLGVPFYNCPTQGKDVVLPIDQIIGGLDGVGNGWTMLMECLAAGRGISLPAQSVGTTKFSARVCSNQGVIRKQFGVSIGSFEGVEEPLARIGGFAYLMEAARSFVCGALDKGVKPPVITAMAKYNQTELGRMATVDAMDIMGGQGISRGPRNLVAHNYIGTPIGITVEGANIMTRTLIIFGQGALRAHPFAFKEVKAVEENSLKDFDRSFWGHVGHVVRNKFRAVVLSFTRGYIAGSPVSGETSRYYQKLSWASATFAIMADMAMGTLGGTLKFREKLTGRFADVLSWMFLATSVLRKYEAEGRKGEDLPFVHYSMQYAFAQIQKAFDGIFANFDAPLLGWLFKGPVRLWSQFNSIGSLPSDQISHEVAKLIQTPGEQRDRICDGIFYPTQEGEPLKRQEDAFKAIVQAGMVERKIRKAIKSKQMPKLKGKAAVEEAAKQGIITNEEAALLGKAEELRYDAITVDSFKDDDYINRRTLQSEESQAKVA